MTGGRLKRALDHIGHAETVLLTYGDGVADIDIAALRTFHAAQGTLATVTAVQPPGRFGALDVRGSRVTHFREKPKGDGAWTNGGFFLLEPGVAGYIDGDDTIWEAGPLRALAHEGQLSSYKHEGHWQVMDTLKRPRGPPGGLGERSPRRGSHGSSRSRILERPPRAGHRQHRLQGGVADAVAARNGGRGDRSGARSANRSVAVRAGAPSRRRAAADDRHPGPCRAASRARGTAVRR